MLGADSGARKAKQAEGHPADPEGPGDHSDESKALQRGEVDQVQERTIVCNCTLHEVPVLADLIHLIRR
jgi:hypothetical protein